jgi:hypothetical protein
LLRKFHRRKNLTAFLVAISGSKNKTLKYRILKFDILEVLPIARSRYGARRRPPSADPFSRAAAAEKISAFLSAAAEPAAAYKFRRAAV